MSKKAQASANMGKPAKTAGQKQTLQTQYHTVKLGASYIHRIRQAEDVNTLELTHSFDKALRVPHISHVDKVAALLNDMGIPKSALTWEVVTVNVTPLTK